MDKIRENAFFIVVGLLSLGLAAFAFFWVVQPAILGDMGASALSAQINKLERYADEQQTPEFPTEELVDAKRDRQARLTRMLEEATKFYVDKSAAFNQLFEEFVGFTPETGPFGVKYDDEILALKTRYIEKYPQAATPTDGTTPYEPRRGSEATGGLVIQQRPSFSDDLAVVRGMKEYWIIEQIMETAMTLDIGGLKAIAFPLDEEAALAGLPEQYEVIPVQVRAELPMAQVDDLVRQVLDSSRVPFELRGLSVRKPAEAVVTPLIIEKAYAEDERARQEKDLEEHGSRAPDMLVTMSLWAIDWKGEPEAGEAEDLGGDPFAE